MMAPLTCLINFIVASLIVPITALSTAEIYSKPVISRIYASEQYCLANADRKTGDRVDVNTVASTLAALKPSYINSLIYLRYGTNITTSMKNDFDTVRSAVLAQSPNAKFDVEVSLNETEIPSAELLVDYMKEVNSQLTVDAWWFDEFSVAYSKHPDWTTAAMAFAHNHSQLAGGNAFGHIVPPDSDAISFIDHPTNSTEWEFGFNSVEIERLRANSSSTFILGHMQSNPQNGNTTESCVYMQNWNSTRRADYQYYWISQQAEFNYTYMIPQFFPECPGAYSYNPLTDYLNTTVPGYTIGSNTTLYDYLESFALSNTSTSTSTSPTTSSTASSTSQANSGSEAIGADKMILAVAALFGLYSFMSL